MPVIECDTADARDRLREAGVEITPGNTDHEQWRASDGDATAVAYEGKVVVQGQQTDRLVGLLRGGGGRAYVYFDGACRGNPGPAAIGYAIVTGDGIVAEGGEQVGRMTNNRAEYEALIRALEAATARGFDTLEIKGDSQLVVKQVRGEWDTNDPDLRERRVRVRELLSGVDWSIEHVPREINERADKLANDAFDASR
jgi:ribonuclease HI